MLKIGVSACLLGDKVRYDGSNKIQHELLRQLKGRAELIGFCPEFAAGMGVPREPIQRVYDGDTIRLLQVNDFSREFTQPLRICAETFVDTNSIHGYIFKARSPSCGVGTTPIWNAKNQQIGLGDGEFVEVIRRRIPDLPLIDEIQWRDESCRENFLAKAEAYKRAHFKL